MLGFLGCCTGKTASEPSRHPRPPTLPHGKALTGARDACVVPMIRILAALLLLSALALAGCSGGEASGTVTLRNNEFDPTRLTIDAGKEVHFEVEEGTHTVTIHKVGDPTTMMMKDVNVAAGADEHFTFSAAGTYHVWCKLHGTMTTGMAMVVTVE